MKKLVLTIVSLVAVATSSFAQFSNSELASLARALNSYSSSSVSYNVPRVTYSVPSTVNYNTTTVSGYTRSNGTYVGSHVRTMPNTTNWDNFSTKGNSNPFTASTGYRAKDYSSGAYNYGVGQTIHTGSRGGLFYYNSRGTKTYVPKRNLW